MTWILENSIMASSLAMDCTAVAAAYGISVRQGRLPAVLKLAAAFGIFQAFLFILGWTLGRGLGGFLGPWDHWAAFLLLSGIGIKMIHESFSGETATLRPLHWDRVIALALATSIDAMVAGLGYALTDSPILGSSVLVGFFSCILPMTGFLAASKIGNGLGPWAERLGGIGLLGIGINLLIEHLRKGI